MDRRRSRIRAVLTTGLALAVATLAAGCGGHGGSDRARAAAYVRQVNRIERTLDAPLALVTSTSTKVGATGGGSGPAALRLARTRAAALRGAERQIRAGRARLAALTTPVSARPLSALLVTLAGRQAQLTEQTARLITFLPAYAAALQRLGPATLALEKVLAVNHAPGSAAVQSVYSRKAAALRTFATTVRAISARLRRLSPPAVSMPGYRAQLASLTGMRSASGQLAAALAAGRTTGLTTLLGRFDRAAAANSTRAVSAAQQAAVRRYDAQVNALSTLSGEAQTERERLAGTLA